MTAKTDRENIRNMYKNMVRLGTPTAHAREYLVIMYGEKLVKSTLSKERAQ